MVNITIDGKQVSVAEGTTVLRAAEQAGVAIPTLCDHKELAPYGGCRLCLVEVEGARTLQPSCTLPVTPNMIVHTATEKVKDARKFVLSLIFSERNHFCMYCQVSGGDCELQNSAYAEGMTHWPLQPNYTPFSVDASNPYFVIDNNRCILCRRCVRACGELVGNFTLGIEERGANSYLVADLGGPIGESSCVSCGTCVQVCPTGAIIDRQSAYNGREKDTTKVKTICTRCSIGCGLEVLTRDNRVVRIDGDWDAEINQGLLCAAGRFEPLINDKDRITTALLAGKDGQKACTVDTALNEITKQIKSGESIAALITDSASLEELSLFSQIFSKSGKTQLGTISGQGFANMRSTPYHAELSTLAEVSQADCIITIGADLSRDHQVAGFMVKRQLPAGTKLIMLADPKNAFAANADLVLDTSKALVPAVKELIQGISDETSSVYRLVKNAGSIGFILGELPNEAEIDAFGKSFNELLDALQKSGKSSRVIHLNGGANGSSVSAFGLDGSVDVKDAKTVLLFQGEETIDQKLAQQLAAIPNLFVIGTYSSALSARAKVVLPVRAWWETAGNYVNIECTVQQSTPVTQAADGVSSMQEILAALGKLQGLDLKIEWQNTLGIPSRP